MSEIVPEYGCGDGGCVFQVQPRRGVHTNGGCHCLQDLLPATTFVDRAELKRQIQLAVISAYALGFQVAMKK
jgi:hypothetical protein